MSEVIVSTSPMGHKLQKPFHWSLASFRGKNNYVKARALMLLYLDKRQGGKGLTARQMAENLNTITHAYLQTRLGFWYEWGYVLRSPVVLKPLIGGNGKGRAVFRYSIGKRGVHFVDDIMPVRIVKEIMLEVKGYIVQAKDSTLPDLDRYICFSQGIGYWCFKPPYAESNLRYFIHLPAGVQEVPNAEVAKREIEEKINRELRVVIRDSMLCPFEEDFKRMARAKQAQKPKYIVTGRKDKVVSP